ncbi:MAG: hypothetical protein IJ383_07155 [Bacteroidales bacterium]|nr:hypothetical protein [Bacteroidales bacterium]
MVLRVNCVVWLKNREKGCLHNGGISIGALDNMVVYTRLKDGRTVIFDPTGNPVDPRLINPMYLVKEGIVYNGGEQGVPQCVPVHRFHRNGEG